MYIKVIMSYNWLFKKNSLVILSIIREITRLKSIKKSITGAKTRPAMGPGTKPAMEPETRSVIGPATELKGKKKF